MKDILKSIKENFFALSKDRAWYINLLLCLFSLVGVVTLPAIFYIFTSAIIKNGQVADIVSEIIFILILILFYYKDLRREFKNIKNDFKGTMKVALKYYVIGLMLMIYFNLSILIFGGGISSNETQVREMLLNNPILSLISIMFTAPIAEELVFRKSLSPIIKNKWIYAICCGALFGGAHLITNVMQGIFVFSDLIYILPYGSLGFVFALMDREKDTTFASMIIHFLHNTITAILLLVVYNGGVM